MIIQKRTMGWIQKPSAYQYSQQLNAKRHALAQSHMDTQSLLSSAIFTAQDTFSHDMVANTLKAVAAKVSADAKAKIDAGLAQIDDTREDILETKASTSSGSDVLDKTV
jgi:hypothetical protein